MPRKQTEAERMQAELIETAHGLHRSGVVKSATLDKITARTVDLADFPKIEPPSGAEIVAIR
jgi:hypothetical protein